MSLLLVVRVVLVLVVELVGEPTISGTAEGSCTPCMRNSLDVT